MPKIHQIWPTRSRFFCNGCVTGPRSDLPGMLYIHCCSFGIVIPYCVFVLGQNWNISPALPILFLVNICFMYLFLFLTACSNPGIIPRRPFLQLNPQKYQKYLVAPQGTNNRNCYTCHIYRPKRTSHCTSCQNCVQIFDHHCGVVGACIGKRNYRYFMLFITFVFISMVLFIINMVIFIIGRTSANVDPTAIIVIVSIVAAVIGLPILIFLIFHLYLLITKKTTRQLLKNIDDEDYQYQNQWCQIDPPIMDLFNEITQQEANLIKNKLQNMGKAQIDLNNEIIKNQADKKP